MKKLIVIILTIVSYNAVAQTDFIGSKGGIIQTSDNYKGRYFTTSYLKSRTGFSGGFSYEHKLKKSFSFVTELIYQQRQYESGIRGFFKRVENYDYLSIPLKGQFNFGKNKLFGFVNLGIIPSILMNARETYTEYDKYNNIVANGTYNETHNNSLINLAGVYEMGIGHKFQNRISIYASVAFQFTYETFTTQILVYGGNGVWHTGKTLSFGLKYALKKK